MMMQQQRGVALISVLLVFALATVIAQQILSRNYADLRKTANMIDSQQADYFALGGEALARQILYRDFSAGKPARVDALTDHWAGDFAPFEISEGKMDIQIIDLQSLFNLNNLVTATGVPNTAAFAEFQRLLKKLDLSEGYAAQLMDWLDNNDQLTAGGAEKSEYTGRGYITSNMPMFDRSELRLLLDMTFEDYIQLRDYVVALPVTTKYNLNTIDATMAAALAPSPQWSAESFQARQERGGYTDVNQWMAAEGQPLSAVKNRASVSSEYFEVRVTVHYLGRVSVLRTQLHRDESDGTITIIKRQQGIE